MRTCVALGHQHYMHAATGRTHNDLVLCLSQGKKKKELGGVSLLELCYGEGEGNSAVCPFPLAEVRTISRKLETISS